MKMNYFLSFVLVFSFLLFGGCATTSNQVRNELKQLVQKNQFDKALELVNSDQFYPEKRSRLLKLIETGTIHYLAGNFYQSVKTFSLARDLSEKLFTVSISKKALSMISNSNADNYYGDPYERSIIRFYLSLSHFMLYQSGVYEKHTWIIYDREHKNKKIVKDYPQKKISDSKRKTHLSAARATVLEWDSLLENYKHSKLGKSTYKDDLTAKIFGAILHEIVGSSADRQIALQLYKDAKKVLFRNYNSYGVFNKKFKEFRDNFSKLHKIKLSTVKKKYVKSTAHSKSLIKFLNGKIKILSKKTNTGNLHIIVQNGVVSPKVAKKIEFPLNWGATSRGGGVFSFAVNTLSLSGGTNPKIAFELPEVKYRKTKSSMKLLITNKRGFKKVTPLVIIDPLSEIAYEALDNNISLIRTKIGARVAAKHMAAILAAYTVYKSMKKKNGALLAYAASAALYAAENKAIEHSERADTRQWSTLPHDLRFTSLNLKKGNYELFLLIKKEGQPLETKKLGNIHLINPKKALIKSFRIY